MIALTKHPVQRICRMLAMLTFYAAMRRFDAQPYPSTAVRT